MFLGQDLNMGTGIKSSKNEFIQHSATLRICVSGDIEAAHGDEIMANESKTGNREEVKTAVRSCRSVLALLGE